MNIMALDMSTHRTGWATIVNEEYKYGAITSASKDVEKRIGIMRDAIVELVKEYKERSRRKAAPFGIQ